MQSQALSYCGQIVRTHDPDRFLMTLLMPADKREALFALFAFNYEIAKTREIVTETQLGLIRLQWWREGIAEIYGGGAVREHAVLLALQGVIQDYDLPQDAFEALIYAREFDLEDVLPASLEGLRKYADFTSTPLVLLALQILGEEADEPLVRQVAVNYAILGLLRSFVFHARQSRLYLPQDLVEQHGIRPSKLYALQHQEGLEAVVEAVAGLIDEAVLLRKENKFLNLMQKYVDMRQAQLRRYGYNPLHSKALLPAPFQALRLMWSAVVG